VKTFADEIHVKSSGKDLCSDKGIAPFVLSFLLVAVPLAVDFSNREHFNTLKETILVASVAGMVFFNLLKRGDFGITLPRSIALPGMSMILWSVVSSAAGINPAMGTGSLIFLLFSFGLIAIARCAFRDGLKLRELLPPLEVGLVIILIYAVFQSMGHDIAFWKSYEGKRKIFSTLGNPNFLASYLISVLPLMIAGASAGRRGIFRWVVVLTGYLMLFLTRSYGAVFAHGAAILAAGWMFSGKGGGSPATEMSSASPLTSLPESPLKPSSETFSETLSETLSEKFIRSVFSRFFLASCCAVVGLMILFLVIGQPAAQSDGVYSHLLTKFRIRAFLWVNSLNQIAMAPLKGTGPGTFSLAYLLGQKQVLEGILGKFDYQRAYVHAHCDILEYAVETGATGMIIIIWLIRAIYIRMRRSCRIHHQQSELRWAVISILGLSFHSMVSFPLRLPATCLVMTVLLGYVIAASESEDSLAECGKESDFKLSLPLRLVPVLLIMGLAVSQLAFLISQQRVSRAERIFAAGQWLSNPETVIGPARAALRIWPENSRAMALIGRVEMYRSNFRDAERWLEAALVHGTDVKVISDLGSVAFFLDDIQKAKVYFAFVAGLNYRPELHKLFFNMGQIELKSGNLLAALGNFGQAIHLKSDSREILFSMGEVYALLGNHLTAVEYYRDLLHLYPEDVRGHYNLALSMEALGRDDAAAFGYARCLALDPDFAQGALNLGVIHYRRGDFATAEELWNRVMKTSVDPDLKKRCLNNLRALKYR
jgi:cytochrome c-type biogenesis protein CcmH/NrfG